MTLDPSTNSPRIFSEFQKTEIEGSIPERFEKQVGQHPDRLALKYGDERLTYSELNHGANQVAHAILNKYKNKDKPVAFLLEHGISQITAMLGILKAGNFYLPLDASFPADRIAYMFEDSQALFLITNDLNLEKAKGIILDDAFILNIDHLQPDLNHDNPGLSIPADSYANLLYTSGSTGEAKGVVQNHCNLLHGIWSVTKSYRISTEDRFALLFSSSYAASVTPILGALLNGAALYPFDLKNDLAFLTEWLIREEISIYISVPTLYRHFASSLTSAENFPHLRLIIIGGEPVIYKDVELFRKYFQDDSKLVVRLAGTEMHRIRTFVIDKNTTMEENIVPVGFKVDDKDVLLLDENGNQVNYGEIGEIVVRSQYISPGYWQKPIITAEKFFTDKENPDLRLFKTGDLGRLRSDGCLYHLGRKDFLVKIRGFRIELEEIEAVLGRHPVLKESVVVVDEQEQVGKRLVAYFVPITNSNVPAVQEIIDFLDQYLPEYMIPAIFIKLDQMPLTPTGKINRRALPPPEMTSAEERIITEPRNDLEEQMVEIWEDVLGVRPLGIHDDFFAYGGHSLLAARAISKIEKNSGKRLPLKTIFESPTAAQIAAVLERGESSPQFSSIVPMQPKGNNPPFFCVHGVGGHVMRFQQLAMYMAPDYPFYAIQSRGIDGRQAPFTDIEEMAAVYIAAVREQEQKGPYYLGGFSFGGFVAYEMARQLTTQGEQVALVALLDTSARKAPKFISSLSRFDLFEYHFKVVVEKSKYKFHRKIQVPFLAKSGDSTTPAKNQGDEDPFLENTLGDNSVPAYFRKVMQANDDALSQYVPGKYEGEVTLFKSIDHGSGVYYGWGELALGGVNILQVPGTHTGIVREPNVQTLAEKLKIVIDSLEDGGGH